MKNVLFLCTGNSARSILCEAILRDLGRGQFCAFSAGSQPSGQPHPDGLAVLQSRGHAIDDLRSKSWDEFVANNAPIMDIIITVCGRAARETCPVWPSRPGHSPLKVHWGMEDPAYIEPQTARRDAFDAVYTLSRTRIAALLALPQDRLTDRSALQAIGAIVSS